MKIILANDTYFPDANGCAYFTHRLANELQKKGHKVLVIAPSIKMSSGYSMRGGARVFGVRSVPILVHKGFRVSPPIMIKKLIRKAVKDFQPDVVHLQGHFFVARIVGEAARKLGIPTVGTNHFMPENLVHYFPLPRTTKEKLMRWAWKKFRLVFDKLDIVTTPTQTAANLIIKHGFAKHVIPISNGIDLELFNPKNDGEYLKKKYDIPERKHVLLYVGRLDKEKNVDFILSSLPDALKKTKFHFVIAGKGDEQQKWQELVEILGLEEHVTFTGFVPDEDLPNLYAMSDCFVIACDVELQSLVTMEAMASSLPVLAVDGGALPELVKPRENGFLFELDSTEKLSAQLVKIFSNHDLRQAMSKKSLEMIREHDIKKTVGEFEVLYESLLTR